MDDYRFYFNRFARQLNFKLAIVLSCPFSALDLSYRLALPIREYLLIKTKIDFRENCSEAYAACAFGVFISIQVNMIDPHSLPLGYMFGYG